MQIFSNYSKYYDAIYKEKNYEQEVAYVIKLIRSINPSSTRVLELGCGTGNHAAFLCNEDFQVTGIEKSPEMVMHAKSKRIKCFNPLVSDITNYSLQERFDVAISLFHVISYLTHNKDLLSCFNVTNAHLISGGIFIFDAWYSPAVYHQSPETRIKRLSVENLEITRIAEPITYINENIVDVDYEIIIRDKETHQTNIFKEKHPMRHFSLPEVDLLANATGFRVIQAEEFVTAKQPGTETWGVCFTLQKK